MTETVIAGTELKLAARVNDDEWVRTAPIEEVNAAFGIS